MLVEANDLATSRGREQPFPFPDPDKTLPDPAYKGRSAESITKLTAWVAAIFFVLIIAIGLLSSRASRVGLTGGAEDKTPSAPTSTPK